MISGIYQILNLVDNKSYIGSSKDIHCRWKAHINKLKSNTHYNLHLQRSWNKYGEVNFKFTIIELVPVTKLKEKEQFHIDISLSYERKFGYNISPKANNSEMSEETKEKLRKANLGKKQSKETVEKRMRKIRGIPKTAEHRKKTGDANRGRKASEKEIENNRLWHLGRTGELCPNSKKVFQYDLDGNFIKEFSSASEAYRINKINNITTCCTGVQKTAGKYFWTYNFLGNKIKINRKYSYNRKTKQIAKYTKDGIFLEKYNSVTEAQSKNIGCISYCLKYGTLSEHTFLWRYL